MFKSWLAEKDMSSIVTALKKAQLENKLLVCSQIIILSIILKDIIIDLNRCIDETVLYL
jgi:hypothetical protein